MDSDQTNEFNVSLNFGNDKRITETQNHAKIVSLNYNPVSQPLRSEPDTFQDENNTFIGTTLQSTPFLQKLQRDFDQTDENIDASSPTQGDANKENRPKSHYVFRKTDSKGHSRNHIDIADDSPMDALKDTQIIGLSKETQADNKDTQVIPVPTDTQIIHATSNTQVIYHRALADTQVIQSPHKPQETQVDEPISSSPQVVFAEAEIERSPEGKFGNLEIKDSVEDNVDDKTTRNSQMDDKTEEAFLTFSNDTPKLNSEEKPDNSKEENNFILGPLTSPISQFTKSTVQIPGTVERLQPQTQVVHTQEEFSEPVEPIEEKDGIEFVDTDEEDVFMLYDDSILAHRMKVKRQLEQNSSPSKKEVIASATVVENEEDMSVLPSKRQRRNVVDSQSQQPLSSSSRPISQSSNTILRNEANTEIQDIDVVSKNSVWANFKFKMYPGTIVSTGKEKSEVLFEEGCFDIDNGDLFPMDIRVGDTIKIKGSTIQYLTSGLGHEPSQSGTGICCVRGYNQVYIKKNSKTRRANTAESQVRLSAIFMELEDWYQHQSRFTINLAADIFTDSITSIINDNMRTPTRSRHTQEIKASPRGRLRTDKGVFSNCLFCITSLNEDTKGQLIKIIYANGGDVVEDGFMELFEYRRKNKLELVLRDKESEDLQFVALISNGISRSFKYLQTVALGWPILSETFIFDTVERNQLINSWPAYLLGAGHSSRIGGVKSLDIHKFQQSYEKGLQLRNQINLNGHLLKKYVVIGLENKANKKETVPFEFIMYAFGVKNLVFKPSTKEILKFIKNGGIDPEHILIYDNSNTHTQALENYKVIDWEWVVQSCISTHIWTF
ncbi:hypothetical protein CANTEDRAFT_95648 [Yamadazyma tenuis ATCC 10573]|uniref:BRCT domain-containing protein n=2 Tax=Candida tenuis TaxID=2315449 RepID=G3BCL1_CANTC|nr:uncharacterized protein CANTEDRAFT_95648 [Yamadazyma tenuis ATCC 10573]EGV60191.1 hypothetical protein CANTEDRAFT_95648 [Yamadazyma tenuis ATCC 10573]